MGKYLDDEASTSSSMYDLSAHVFPINKTAQSAILVIWGIFDQGQAILSGKEAIAAELPLPVFFDTHALPRTTASLVLADSSPVIVIQEVESEQVCTA